MCIYPKEGQEKEKQQDGREEKNHKNNKMQEKYENKNTKDGRNKPAISVIKESIRLTFTI